MILIIDNYDSFTYNIYQYVGHFNLEVEVIKNDEISISEIKKKSVDRIIISPGPGHPKDSKVSLDCINHLGLSVPILGICLGHQAIGVSFGAKIINSNQIVHGKTSMVSHNKDKLFKGIANPFEATRYHSLLIDKTTVPGCLEITSEAVTDEQEIMGVQHKEYPVYGVQFHPESILTGEGKKLLNNFLQF